jgi:hypothetical protein
MLVGDKVNEEQTKCYCGHTTTCDCGPEIDGFKHIVKVIPKKEILANRSNAYEFIDFYKQETLEEFIEKEGYPKGVTQEIWEQGVREGAKWQQEQIGKSEFLQKLRATLSDAEARRLINETFKNK